MMRWKSGIAGVVVVVVSLVGVSVSRAAGAGARPATGVGSCTIKNWNPALDPDDAKDLPQGARPQTYKPDDFDCTSAAFAADGVEFAKFPQPSNFRGTSQQAKAVSQPAAAINPLAPYFPPYSYVELFNDHPGAFQDIPKNDAVTKQVVDFIMNNAAYKDNTVVVVTEDDTQNGSNGPDHVSNTFRVPTVVVASPTYMKQNYTSHVAYTTSNVLAAMERVMNNVHPGV